MTRQKPISTVALVVALLALVASLSGGAVAAAFIDGGDIKKNAIKSKHIKKQAVKSSDVKNNGLKGKDIKDGSLSEADLAAGTSAGTAKSIRVAATSAAGFDNARIAAPEHVLFTSGPFTVYAKCFTESGGPTTYGYFYIRTSTNGAVVDSYEDDWYGYGSASDYLNSDTPEDDRELFYTSTSADSANYYADYDGDFFAYGADGTGLSGMLGLWVKNGTVGANGPYGSGDACLFVSNIHSN